MPAVNPESTPRHTSSMEPTTGGSYPLVQGLKDETRLQRLTRLAAWCTQGCLTRAELELHEWTRQEDCPPAATVMLASLLARRGRRDQACELVARYRATHGIADPALKQLYISLLTSEELVQAAAAQTRKLHERFGQDPSVADWVRYLEPCGSDHLRDVPQVLVEQLAGELLGDPKIIPTLVAAVRAQADVDKLLLRQALACAFRDFTKPGDQLVACQALAELALISHDPDEARRWAHRGLKLDPYQAGLALVLAQVADDHHVGPAASEVLEQVAAKHPRYPDVQASLVRRLASQGQLPAARRQLARWMREQPAHPLMKQIDTELAA